MFRPLLSALGCLVAPLLVAQVITPTLTATLIPGEPSTTSHFGTSVTTVGGHILVGGAPNDTQAGSSNSGMVYVYSTNGTRLHDVYNPSAGIQGRFGRSLAAVGHEMFIVGDDSARVDGIQPVGLAYLYATNGTLVTTFTNPAHGRFDGFGYSVAGVGFDKILIACPGQVPTGAAYLFHTNGTLLHTFTSPETNGMPFFGKAVAAFSTDKVLIAQVPVTTAFGTDRVHLFNVDGTLVKTLISPNFNSGTFGDSLAAAGPDKVIIGAWNAFTGGFGGDAYIFSTNGTLITNLANGAPVSYGQFGRAVLGLGNDKVVVTASASHGEAFIFKTNGTLIGVITNPSPSESQSEQFGFSAATLGVDQVFIGAIEDNGALGAFYPSGAAYLFTLYTTIPSITFERWTNGQLRLSWPRPAHNFMLERRSSLAATNPWTPLPFGIETNDTHISRIINPAIQAYYRLSQP